jgi:hypothetical protein
MAAQPGRSDVDELLAQAREMTCNGYRRILRSLDDESKGPE